MDRSRIVEALEELAALSELTGENPFKAKAYANAARVLHKASAPEEEWATPGVLESIPGVGKGTAERVRELVATGSMADLEGLRAKVPAGVREILSVPGLGPKKVASLWKELGIVSLGELEYACIENRLVSLPGFGAKTQDKVLAGVRFKARQAGRVLLPSALASAAALEAKLRKVVGRWGWAGEAARLCPVVSGLEVVAEAAGAGPLAEALGLARQSEDRFAGTGPDGLAIRLYAAPPEAFGSSLVWHASGAAFRDALRAQLSSAGFTWGPEGLSRQGARVPAADEAGFWRALSRPPVPAECRELAAALESAPGDLLREEDIRGSFHVHTDWSDGGATLEEMVSAAEGLGWEYLGICDHSASAVYAGGLSPERLAAQRQAIARVQADHPDIRIFAGVESDILADGALDYGEAALASLDLVVASVHSRFGLDEGAQTARLVRALSHGATTFLGHPTGRLLLAREPYSHRWADVVAAAGKHGKAIELNANPHRLDVDWSALPGLRAAGVAIGINPDAHSVQGLSDVRYGVWAARKGLAGRRDVINTMAAGEVADYLERSRRGI